jgi:hypothetical protein
MSTDNQDNNDFNSEEEDSGKENELLDERKFEELKANGGEMGNVTVHRYQGSLISFIWHCF